MTKLALAAFLLIAAAVSPAAAARLFLTQEKLASLRAKAAANDADWLAVKARADALLGYSVPPYVRTGCVWNSQICYEYQGHTWLESIEVLGLAYQVTGDVRYADKVIAVVNRANEATAAGDLGPISVDAGYPSRSVPVAMALAYDWTYDRMTASTRAATVASINAWFDWTRANAFAVEGPAYDNYFGGHLLGYGLAALATSGDNPRAAELSAWVRTRWDREVAAALTAGAMAGGYASESFSYGANHHIRYLQYVWALRTATGEDLLAANPGLRNMAVSLIHNLKPNRWQVTDEGDWPGSYTGLLNARYPLFLAAAFEGTTEGRWMQHLVSNLAVPPPGASAQAASAYERFFLGDSSRPSSDYRLTLSTHYRSAGDEHVYVRSSWSDGAVWASFAAGGAHFTGHEMKKAGHVAIQRGSDYLLVNSGQWKGTTGIEGNPQAFQLAAWRGNTLFFDDLGEYMYTGESYVGGQGVWGTNNILADAAGVGWRYVKSDFTDAYDRRDDQRVPASRSLRSFTRSFAMLGDVVVLFDRVKALKPTYVKKLYFHMNPAGGAPAVSGNVVRSNAGASSLFLKVLLPASPVVATAADPVSPSNPAAITYRAEVSDSVSGTDLTGLTVLIATASGAAAMPDTRLLATDDGAMAGALLAGAASPAAVLFSTAGAARTSASYSAAFGAGQRALHLLADMRAGSYDVYQDGARIAADVAASTDGALSFAAVGPGAFQVVPSSSPAPGPGAPSAPVPGSVTVHSSSISARWELSSGAASYTLAASTLASNPPSAVWASSAVAGGAATVSSPALAANTSYFLFVSATGAGGTSAYAAFPAAATRAAAPAAAAAGTFVNVARSSFSVRWSRNGNPFGTAYVVELSTASDFNAGAPSISFSTAPGVGPGAYFGAVSPDTTYYFRVRAVNHGGLPTAYAVLGSTRTLGVPDVSSPSVPAGLSATAVSPTQVSLSWSGSTDDVAVAAYRVFRDGVQVASTAMTTYADSGRSPSTAYSYRVAAVDAAGNASAQSAPASVTTLAPDVARPSVSVPSLAAGQVVRGSVTITAAASDDVAVATVQFRVDGFLLAVDTSSPYSFVWQTRGLRNGEHSVTVTALDAVGNSSATTVIVRLANPGVRMRLVRDPATAEAAARGVLAPSGQSAIFSLQVDGVVEPSFPAASSLTADVDLPSGRKTLPLVRVAPGVYHGPAPVTTFGTPDWLALEGAGGTVTVGGVAYPAIGVGNGILPPVGGAVREPSGMAHVVVQPGGVTDEAAFEILPMPADAGGRRADALRRQNLSLLGSGREIHMYSSGTLNSATVLMPVDPALLGSARPTQAKLAYFNPTSGAWEIVEDSTLIGGILQARVTHFSIYAPVLVTPSVLPGLRDTIVFPNPAVAGQDPTIRASLGVLDSVEITIYGQAGRKVHSVTLTGAPTGVVGGDFVYDYKWTGQKASGVYYAVIHGKTSDGRVIKTRAKFAVVR